MDIYNMKSLMLSIIKRKLKKKRKYVSKYYGRIK